MPSTPLPTDEARLAYQARNCRQQAEDARRCGYTEAQRFWETKAAEAEHLAEQLRQRREEGTA